MGAPTKTLACADCGQSFEAKFAKYFDACRWKHRRKKPRWVWTPERDQLLRDRYDNRVKGRSMEIARKLGFPKWAVSRRAAELGLTHSQDRKPWTPDEEAFLFENAGTRHVNWIAKRLKRSLISVVLKCKRMKISQAVREGYTLRELGLCFGCDHHGIERWVREGKLQVKRRHNNGAARDPWFVTDAEILQFVKENPMAFRLDKVDQVWFMDLITSGGLIRKALAAEAALDAPDSDIAEGAA